jgi:RHS repeat-associated protein
LLKASDGSPVAKYEYSPSGELLRAEGSYALTNPFRFSTKFTDDESGLVYYGARYYGPSLGRFITRDPIGELGGLNLYGFCGNDSINRFDYLGYQDETITLANLDVPGSRIPAGSTLWNRGAHFRGSVKRPSRVTLGKAVVNGRTYIMTTEILVPDNAPTESDFGEIRAVRDPGFMNWDGAVANLRGFRDHGLAIGSMLAHPVAAYRSFKTVREPLTPYGSKLDNFLISSKIQLSSSYGRGGFLFDLAAAKGLGRFQAIAGDSIGAFRSGLAAENGVSLTARLEANAAGRLSQLENANGAHFLSRHGAGTTIEQQYIRATTGLTPDGFAGRLVDSSRFLSNRAQLAAVQRAEAIFAQTGQRSVTFQMSEIVGEGFTRGGGSWVQTTNVQGFFTNGKLNTLYPLLSPLP